MSHELRTPLTAVLGFSRAVRDDYRELTDQQREGFLDAVVQSGEHLVSLVDDLLDLAKIEASRIELQNEATSIAEVCQAVDSTLRQESEAKSLSLEFTIDDAAPAVVYSDPLRLRQLLLNLVANAVKFTDTGGVKVAIASHPAVLPNHFDLTFEVSDTGIGINMPNLEQLTQPFEQVDSSLTRSRPGTGLGLAICKRLIELMGGTFELESEARVGSRFRFSLPVLAAQMNADQREPTSISPQADSLAGRRVLLVEDNPDTQRLVQYLLGKLGAEVEIGNDGEHAVERLLRAEAGRSIDILLMDMQMPVLDGYQATQRLRQAGVATPIIALTAHSMLGDRQACLMAGCDDYLSKPFGADELLAILQKWAPASTGSTDAPGELLAR